MATKLLEYTFNNTISDCIPQFLGLSSDGYTISDSVSDNITTRIINVNDGVSLPTRIWFSDDSHPEGRSLLTLEYLDTSNINNMNMLFCYCNYLTSVNTIGWDTSNVTDMTLMFFQTSNLQNLTLSNFDVTNCTSFYRMFEKSGIVELNFIGNSTNSSVGKNMNKMFADCYSLTKLSISNIPNINNMSWMFSSCSKLESLNLIGLDTSNCTDFTGMFYGCSSLTSLDLSLFNTSKANSMQQMFIGCDKITSLDLLNFNTSKVTDMAYMFQNCSSLTSLDLSNFDTSQVTSMYAMFQNCSSLTSLDLSNWNLPKLTTMGGMFSSCAALSNLIMPKCEAPLLNNMQHMFVSCTSLTEMDMSEFVPGNLTSIGYMFNNCNKLQYIDLNNFVIDKVTYIEGLFNGCSSLKTADCSNMRWTRSTDLSAFYGANRFNTIALLYIEAEYVNKWVASFRMHQKTNPLTVYYYDADPTQLTPIDGVTFIKYEFPTTISLPPHISLYALPDGTRDELDVKTGILTRRLSKFVLDGSFASSWRVAVTSGNTVLERSLATGEPNLLTLINNYGFPKVLDKNNSMTSIPIDTSLANTNNVPKKCPSLWMDAYFNNNFIRIAIPNGVVNDLNQYNYSYNDANTWLNENPITIIYKLSTPTTEKLILNYNHSCEYGMVLPKGAVDYYDVVNSKYHKNIGSVYLQGDETWQSAEEYDKCVRFGIEFRGTGESNIKPGGGLYCDNDLFPNIDDDSDVEHCRYASDDSNILYFYVDKTRLMSPDLVGWQIWQQENPYTMYFELADTVTLDKPYEELDPNLARWETMDCSANGGIEYSGVIYPKMDYVTPSVNNFDVEMLEPNTMYTVYADNVEGSLDLGGNTSDFVSGSTFTSGENKWLTFNSSPDVENIMLIKGDTTDEVVPYFTGVNSVVNPKVQTPNRNIFDGELEKGFYGTGNGQPAGSNDRMRSKNYIEVKPNTTYTYSDGTNTNVNILFYTDDKTFIKAVTTITFTTPQNAHYIKFYTVYDGTSDLTSYQIQIEEGSVATGYVPHGGSTVTTNLTLRSSESGVKDSYNVLTGELTQRVDENLQVLEVPIKRTLDPQELLAYEDGQILLSSESGLIPTLTYATPSTNTFHLPSMKTGTRYTLKYPSASGNITIGNIKYNINSPSMLFTTPLTIVGDTSAIIFSDENPQDVMLIEGAYNTREIPLFTGVKSVVNPTINIIDNGTEESRTYRCQEEVELRSLPNGVADKLDIVGGKLTRAVSIRPYQEGDEDLPNTLTDGYNTIYQLSKPTVSSVTFVTPVVTSDSTMHLSSEALIPQLNYRVPSNNNFPLDLLEPNKTYTLYANTLVSGSYTLGGTHNGYFTGTEVIALGDVTNNLLTFDGDLGLSDVVLIKGNSMNSELPYFEGLKTVENATITIAGIQGEENSIILDDSITLRACGDIKDTIDMVNLVMTQNLSEITLKGTEPWSLITTNESINDEYVLFGLVIGGIKSSVTTSLVCDKFNHKYQSGEMHNQEGIYAVNNQLRICVKKTTIGGETVDAIKTWLGQNNTRVIYALINPIEYQLQNSWTSTPPTSYNNRTTISSQVVDSLKPMISVTIATTTLEEIVSNLETRNTQLEEENLATMLALTSVYELMSTPSVTTTETQVPTYGGMSVSPMGMVYAKLVSKGFKTIEEVPYNLQTEVMYALRGME